MRILGLPKQINDQLSIIPDIRRYFEELAANPSYAKTGEAEHLLDSIKKDCLKDTIIHIGKHNALPPISQLKDMANGEYAEIYTNGTDLGWTNLRFLMSIVKAEFMSKADPLKMRYTRQVALFCRGCGEYKATGMFEFETKDRSYTRVKFKEEHIIDPQRTTIVQVRRKRKKRKKMVHCIPCNTSNQKSFEMRYEGVYASAREYSYDHSYLEELAQSNSPLPGVIAVRIRPKEPASEAEKMAYLLSGKKKEQSRHFRALQENREQLEAEIGKDTLDLLISDGEHSIYDKFGIRILALAEENCYSIWRWFKKRFPFVREVDYIEHPKEENNYRSLHATLVGLPTDSFTTEPIPIDLQIRTKEMDDDAERGSAAWGPDKKRKELIDHKSLLAITALRYYLFGA